MAKCDHCRRGRVRVWRPPPHVKELWEYHRTIVLPVPRSHYAWEPCPACRGTGCTWDRVRPFWVHAEHCPGPFYHGWWLYADVVVNGRPEQHAFTSAWLRYDWQLAAARALAERAGGFMLPPAERFGKELAAAVARQFPDGFLAEGEADKFDRWRVLPADPACLADLRYLYELEWADDAKPKRRNRRA